MKLKSAQITRFKCINDSGAFAVDEDITCLVGKNESGKTAVLQALNKINSTDATLGDFSDLDYPRHGLSEYRERGNPPDAAITTVWEIEKSEREELSALIGSTALNLHEARSYKGYGLDLTVEITLNEAEVVQHLIAEHQLLQDEADGVSGATDVKELKKMLGAIEDPSQRQKALAETIKKRFGDSHAKTKVSSFLKARIPKFAYFHEYLRLPGQISLTQLKQRKASNTLHDTDKVFLALLGMINRSIEDLEKLTQFESLQADLESASSRITKEIFRYWSQNRHLRVQFRFEKALPGDAPPFNDGMILRTRIENQRHGVTTSFDQRSTGFVWFFSFLVWFSQLKKNHGDNLVILLDEPGLSLHAKAQADLLRYMEEQLAPHFQVIYTTHSPFMIDPHNLLRTRTVEDKTHDADHGELAMGSEALGTKVSEDVLVTDRDTIFPLQACLGYEIAQPLFIGAHTLLVEGPADLLYLKWFQSQFTKLGKPSLDSRWTITPCGGLDKIGAFLALFAGNKLHVAVLTDFASGAKSKVRTLKESKLLKEGHVFTADAYAGRTEADIEDILGASLYIELVNKAYALNPPLTLPEPMAATDHSALRIVQYVEAEMSRRQPAVYFDHYRPAEHLVRLGDPETLPGFKDALGRFERLFSELNRLLPV